MKLVVHKILYRPNIDILRYYYCSFVPGGQIIKNETANNRNFSIDGDDRRIDIGIWSVPRRD